MHIGDTWLEAPEGCRMEDLRVAEIAGLHRYAPVQGLPALLSAVARRVERAQGVETRPNDVLVTAGATGGFGAVLGAVCAPGDEVVVCAPYWPLITGIVRGAHAVPVVVSVEDPVDVAWLTSTPTSPQLALPSPPQVSPPRSQASQVAPSSPLARAA